VADSKPDIHATKTYGHEKVGRQFLLLAAVLCGLGAVGVAVTDPSSDKAMGAWVILLAGGVWVVFELLIRPARPGPPLLELSPEGITLRTAGTIRIPWHEVRGVDAIDLTTWPAKTAPFPVTFSNLTVVRISRDFYDAWVAGDHGAGDKNAYAPPVRLGTAWENTFLPKGQWVQVALHHDILPVEPDTLRREVATRWHAFRGPDRPEGAAQAPATSAEDVKTIAFRINWDKP
jgi:hypothetical protein